MTAAIQTENLGKRYLLGERADAYLTLRDSLASVLNWRQRSAERARREELWAIRDLNLELEEGEVVGVIGRNGAGKSTLLKLIARITEPTTGIARMRGRVGALLEVGTGFHPELTGRENVFLNGAVLGMSRREIRMRFDEIVHFAGVERFLDTPLKRYSTGMKLRLAFAVAAHFDPDIVTVDEVLAVGDAEFQEKCLGRMSEFKAEGRTVLFVSHDLGAIGRLCRRVIWIERGQVKADGPPDQIFDLYLKTNIHHLERTDFASDPHLPVQLLAAAVTDEEGDVVDAPRWDQPLRLRLRFRARESIPNLDLAVSLVNRDGTRVLDECWSDHPRTERLVPGVGEFDVTVTIPGILRPGDYVASLWVGAPPYDDFFEREVLSFRLWPREGDRQEWVERQRVILPPVAWTVSPSSGAVRTR